MNTLKIFRKGILALLVGATALVACSKDSDSPEVPKGNYGVLIGGVELTYENYQKINKDNFPAITEGTVTYDPIKRILTLDNATIQTPEVKKSILRLKEDGITVKLIGNNTLKSKDNVLYVEKPALLIGDGTLKIIKTRNAISIDNASLTIENCTVILNAEESCIRGGNTNSSATLIIRNAKIEGKTTDGKEKPVICKLAGLTMEGCAITEPEGAAFDETLKGVAKDGKLVENKVIIAPPTP